MSLPNTHLGPAAIGKLLDGKQNLFFDGIGGISMNSLAHISHLRGYRVSGYDRVPSDITRKLEAMGVTVFYEASEEHVRDCDALIYTVAMPDDNPEYACARTHGIPLISRADYLGYLMTGYTHRIGVSGTHGKSTTTGMISRILSAAGVDPTVFNGAPMKETGSVDRIGGHGFFAFEACEYMDSFLDFYPTVAVILNIDMDHLDYFHSIEQLRDSFTTFMNITGKDGYAVINLNDENSVLAAKEYIGHTVTFGRNNPDADYSSSNEDVSTGYPAFDVIHDGKTIAHIALAIPGEHNIADALASFAACSVCGIEPDAIASGLCAYEGICRRMEKLCLTRRGAAVYSDYAHHPTEIAATIRGARKICRGKLRIVFQPHTYSRTAELFDSFVDAFTDSEADEVLFCDIYPAREVNVYGVSSAQLAEKLSTRGKSSAVAADFADAAAQMADRADPGDMIIVMGAGDVIEVADRLVALSENK